MNRCLLGLTRIKDILLIQLSYNPIPSYRQRKLNGIWKFPIIQILGDKGAMEDIIAITKTKKQSIEIWFSIPNFFQNLDNRINEE